MYGVYDALYYSIDFSYAEGFAHRLDHAGDRYYSYDDDGNVVRERNEAMPDSSGTDTGSDDDEWDDWDDWDDDWGDGLGEAGFGFGMGGSGSGSGNDGTESGNLQATVYERIYEWDERDRLTGSTEGNTVVGYVYGEDGNRSNKYSSIGETLYFSSMWTWHDAKSLGSGGQTTKNIYLGTERIVSKLNRGDGLDTYSEEYHKTYYWHSDHLGSAHFITDYQGNEYQRIEYTPYGEEWVELKADSGDQYMPYKFTGKERDEETGLYYYGARYLDPVYSRWLSTDPAVGEYLPTVGADNSNLPGMGGVFNTVNMQLYHYAGNTPIRYIDPDGKKETNADDTYIVARLENPVYIPKLDENGNVIYSYDIFGGFEFEEIDTVIIKPHTSIDGKYDGTRNVNGDYSKYAGKSWLPEVDCIVYSDHIEITNALGKIVSCLGDTPEGKNGDSLIFKLHKKGSKEALELSNQWDKKIKEDLNLDSMNDFTNEKLKELYNSPKQKFLRSKLDPKRYPYTYNITVQGEGL